MAEELGLHQVLGDRRHVEGNERRCCPRAVTVQGMSDELLAGTGLAIDQYGDIGVRQPADGPEYLLHRRRFTDDFRGARLYDRHVKALLLLGMLIGTLDQRYRFVDIEGFGQVLEGATLIGRYGAVQIRMGGHDDHRQARVHLADSGQQLQAAGARHANVGDDHVRLLTGQATEHAIGAVEALGAHALLLQGLFQDPADGAVVVNDPYGFTAAHVGVAPCSSGRKIENTVLPGWLSHSIRP